MAALLRGTKFGCRALSRIAFSRSLTRLIRPHIPAIPLRVYSSTSKKVNQSEYVTGKRTEIDEERVQEIIREGEREERFSDPDDPSYVFHGFSEEPHVDFWSYRLICFTSFSIALVVTPLFIHFLPDGTGRDWAKRQAEYVIQDRRQNGIPIISPDMCDPDKLVLPSEEEEERVWKAFRP